MSVQAQIINTPVAAANFGLDFDESAHPLESIAHVLGRIEHDLARIAAAIENSDASEKLRLQLQGIDQAIRIQGLDQKLHAR
jgi:hypothetical protein